MDIEKINEKIGAGREYRRAQNFEIRKLTDGEEDKKTVEGYATTFNDEYLLYDFGDVRVYESVDAHAFDGCDMSDVIMQYDHVGRVFARLSNGTLRIKPDDHGLHISADLGGTQIGRDLYDEIAGGYTNKMSFGFIVAEEARTVVEDYDNDTAEIHRTITKFKKLFDVSAVSLPANNGTEIEKSARAYCDGVIAVYRQEIAAKRARVNKIKALKLKLEVEQ